MPETKLSRRKVLTLGDGLVAGGVLGVGALEGWRSLPRRADSPAKPGGDPAGNQTLNRPEPGSSRPSSTSTSISSTRASPACPRPSHRTGRRSTGLSRRWPRRSRRR